VIRLLTSGESHGPELTVIVEGLPAGVRVDPALIDQDLVRRQGGFGRGARSTRIERDRAAITSGLAGGVTTGAPIGLRIANRDFANQPPQQQALTTPRPGHADLAGRMKFGVRDFRLIRERASARETAARVAAGALAKQLLGSFGGMVGSFVTEIGGVHAWSGTPREGAVDPAGVDILDAAGLRGLAEAAEADPVRCPVPQASQRMRVAIDGARTAGDTLGGAFVVFATAVPAGLGSYTQWDRRLDGRLAQAFCSIPAVKGVEIGPAFRLAGLTGKQAHDAILRRGGVIVRSTNRAGGLEGGVTNGQPLVLRAAMKPLPSIRAPVESVDFESGLPADAPYIRSDVCSVPAAAVVGEAMMAWVLADALVERFGADRLDAMLAAWAAVRDADAPSAAIDKGRNSPASDRANGALLGKEPR
jgi:chorismate synthase